jgi:hypothetical protein
MTLGEVRPLDLGQYPDAHPIDSTNSRGRASRQGLWVSRWLEHQQIMASYGLSRVWPQSHLSKLQ